MIIRNQNLIKWPWIVPVCSTIGAAVILFQPDGLSIAANTAIFVGTIAAINVFFFLSLKQTKRIAKKADPAKTEPVKPRTWYLLCLWGGIGMLLTVVSGYYVDARGPMFLGSEVSKASSALLLFWFARNFKKKIKD